MSERILICGDRKWNNLRIIQETLERMLFINEIECVIEGEARGADSLGRLAAQAVGIKVLPFPARWDIYGKSAGPIRNQQMLDEGKPTVVLAFHNNIAQSKGTADMVRRAKAAGVHTEIIQETK